MNTVFALLAGLITIIGVAIPVYFKWKKAKDELSKNITIARDNYDLHERASKRVHDRLEAIRKSSGASSGE